MAAADHPDVHLVERYVAAEERDAIFVSCDLYASLHRSEGFGLTLAEAMAAREDADGAEYRMRRLFVPDLAVQWVHRAFTAEQFEQLLAHLFHFLDERPRRAVGRARVAEVAREMYVEKLRARIAQLDALPVGRRVEATLVAGGLVGGVAALLERYLALYDALAPRRRDAKLSVSHGDLGFSNVLYSSATQTFQLIDPRGADTAEELFSDPYYDVAKLSHSILGDYDFLVAGFYQLVHDEHLGLTLAAEGPPAELRELFLVALAENGYDRDVARLGEASLFLSMLPLHVDSPKRVTAFALRARSIIDELEARR